MRFFSRVPDNVADIILKFVDTFSSQELLHNSKFSFNAMPKFPSTLLSKLSFEEGNSVDGVTGTSLGLSEKRARLELLESFVWVALEESPCPWSFGPLVCDPRDGPTEERVGVWSRLLGCISSGLRGGCAVPWAWAGCWAASKYDEELI